MRSYIVTYEGGCCLYYLACGKRWVGDGLHWTFLLDNAHTFDTYETAAQAARWVRGFEDYREGVRILKGGGGSGDK